MGWLQDKTSGFVSNGSVIAAAASDRVANAKQTIASQTKQIIANMPSLEQVTNSINQEMSDIEAKMKDLTEEGKQELKLKLLQQVEKLYFLIIELSMKDKFKDLKSWDASEFTKPPPQQAGKRTKKRRKNRDGNKKKTMTLKR